MVTFHSDVELMLQHLQILTNSNSTSNAIIQSLIELEYYVHQIDNARDLDVLGGLAIIVRLLNHSDSNVQCAAAFTLGAAVQRLGLLWDVIDTVYIYSETVYIAYMYVVWSMWMYVTDTDFPIVIRRYKRRLYLTMHLKTLLKSLSHLHLIFLNEGLSMLLDLCCVDIH